jgi:uridine kinase
MSKNPFVIGISGAVGSGKTWFANRLKESISKPVCIFTLDIYSKDEEYVNGLEFRYDNPQAINYDKAYAEFSKLRKDKSVKLPVYDYASHRVVSEITCNAPSVIIIEGLYAFWDKRFLDEMDFKIWIEADEQICKERRIRRDVKERGESFEESMRRHINDSEPAFDIYYKKGKRFSDCMFYNVQANSSPKLIEVLNNHIYGKR